MFCLLHNLMYVFKEKIKCEYIYYFLVILFFFCLQGQATPVKVKIPHPHVKKSKILLGKAGVINVLQEDTPPPPPKSPDRDPFNISNDL